MNYSAGTLRAKLWVVLSTLVLCIASVALVYLGLILLGQKLSLPNEERFLWRFAMSVCAVCMTFAGFFLIRAERTLRRLRRRKRLPHSN